LEKGEESKMRGRKAPAVELDGSERQELERIVKRHSTPQQMALRARIVLASGAGVTNEEIARKEAVAGNTVRRWRGRWLALQAIPMAELTVEARLQDEARSGNPGRIGEEQVCQIVALACEAPAVSGRPISQWSSREIADEVMRRGIVERISARHAARLLKRGIFNPTAFATG
jgi:putative transposase